MNRERIAEAIRARGLTITQAAEVIGVSRQTVHGWINGKNISNEYIKPLCELTGISADSLFSIRQTKL